MESLHERICFTVIETFSNQDDTVFVIHIYMTITYIPIPGSVKRILIYHCNHRKSENSPDFLAAYYLEKSKIAKLLGDFKLIDTFKTHIWITIIHVPDFEKRAMKVNKVGWSWAIKWWYVGIMKIYLR